MRASRPATLVGAATWFLVPVVARLGREREESWLWDLEAQSDWEAAVG
jgi:hypothetical protein